MASSRLESLTPREYEILGRIGEGESLPEIARRLGRSLSTIESHRVSLGEKLKVSNRLELAQVAISEGVITSKALRRRDPKIASSSKQTTSFDTEGAEDEWLKPINQGLDGTVGPQFLRRFCDLASQLPMIRGAGICVPDPDYPDGSDPYRRHNIFSSDRGNAGEPMRHHVMGTPMGVVLEQGQCCVMSGLQDQFPGDAWLQSINAQSFVGLLLKKQGKPIGIVGVIGDEPLLDAAPYMRLLRHFAPRLTSEVVHHQAIEKLSRRCESLETQASIIGNLQADQHPELQAAITRIEQAGQHLTGAQFLRMIVDIVTDMFSVFSTGICTVSEQDGDEWIASLLVREGESIVDNFRYMSALTPCEVVLNEGFHCVTQGAIAAYPEDKLLADMGIDAYIGIDLPGCDPGRRGIMWCVDHQSIRSPDTLEAVLRHYAPRIGAELNQFMHMEKLMQERERLEEQVAELQAKAAQDG